jgi:hypothetical protein
MADNLDSLLQSRYFVVQKTNSNPINVHMICKHSPVILLYVLSLLLLMEGCGPFNNLARSTYSPSTYTQTPDAQKAAMQKASPFVKLHMKSGTVFVLDNWASDKPGRIISGRGLQYSTRRDTIAAGQFSIGLDSVLIIETNELSESGTNLAFTIFLGVTGGVAAFCIFNPKTCFGSCPTFYVSDIDTLRPRAEGFSASIAPSLEASDCDALGEIPLSTNRLTIEMRNEALETHVVRSVELLAVPKRIGSSIYKDDRGSFWECDKLVPPSSAVAEEGDCLALLSKADGHERMSRADSTNLAAKETIELTFDRTSADTNGIVIECRQSLMTTFLFYKTLGFMGTSAGAWFAEMERDHMTEPMNAMKELLGGIDVSMKDSTGVWSKIGSVLEYGPLATDIHLLRLPHSNGLPLRVRLEMTKGYWRIDNVGIARMNRSIEPIRLQPSVVLRDGVNDVVARALLMDSTKTLVTTPGENYTMHFDLPDRAERYGLFLESRGYYLEWIRDSWLRQEDPLALAELLLDPARALRRLAPEFSHSEHAIEAQFWRSKYAH